MLDNLDVKRLIISFSKLSRIQTVKLTSILEEYDISLIHAQYLSIFTNHDKSYTLKEITDLVGTNKSTTTRTIKAMLGKNLLKKVDSNMKRGYELELTEKGKNISNMIANDLLEYHLKMISALDNKVEEKQLIYLYNKLLKKLEETEYKVLM